MQISELIERTMAVVSLFDQVEPRHWGVEAMVVELCGEVGTLSDSVMIKEGYRELRDGTKLDIEDDIADIIFMIIRIANYYDINLEESYQRMLDETREKLEKRLG